MMDAAKITPAECGALADSSAQIPEGSTYAAGGAESAKEETITVLTLVAVTDPELLSSNVEASEANSTKCANFTLEFQGQKITNTTEVLDVKTTGDNSFSSLSTQTLPSGQTVTTVMVMGLKGTLSATAVRNGDRAHRGCVSRTWPVSSTKPSPRADTRNAVTTRPSGAVAAADPACLPLGYSIVA